MQKIKQISGWHMSKISNMFGKISDGVKSLIFKLYDNKVLQERVFDLMKDASNFVGMTGAQKKEFVIDKTIAFYEVKYSEKVPFISKEYQVIILTSILSTLIEKLYQKYFKK